MTIAELVLWKRKLTVILALALLVAGILSYGNLGRLEDPDFTIKTAIVMTSYEGASPVEVEQEVTDLLEIAIQQLGEVNHLRSISRAGQSFIYVDIKDQVSGENIPQVWDKLRKKLRDVHSRLPPGAGTPLVIDDYGDVYGAFFAISGDGYSAAELEEYAKFLRMELLRVTGVAKVELWGVQPEALYLEMSRSKMAELGITPQQIAMAIGSQSKVLSSGRLHVDERCLRIASTGAFESVADIENLLIRGAGSESMIRLSDVVTVRRDYVDPPQSRMLYCGKPALGLGISTVAGGNVVATGERIRERLQELEADRPIGIELEIISFQADTVTEALDAFILSFIAAVAIVICLLLVFMGLRSGLLIGGVLLLDIVGTFWFMDLFDVTLQRISLGALIIAMGMLVDNAIVVTEGMLVRMKYGEERVLAARESVRETMWPLLGATFIAILAFAAISMSEDSAGEFLSSLFMVIAISLLLSWILAVTVTPLLGVMMLGGGNGKEGDPYGHRFYRHYRRFLAAAIHWRWATIVTMLAALAGAVVGFGYVDRNFFPDSGRPQFLINYWRSEGTHIDDTGRDMAEISAFIQEIEGVEAVTSFIGQGGLRFLLTYEGEMPSSSYGQLLVTVQDNSRIEGMIEQISAQLHDEYPDAEAHFKRFALGPGGAKVAARFSGENPDVLRSLAEQAKAIMRAEPTAKDVRDDWRQRVPVLSAEYAEARARRAGVSRGDLGQALEMASSGRRVGVYRDGDTMLPIIARLPAHERTGVDALRQAQVWSSVTGRSMPLGQVVSGLGTVFEDPIIRRRDRRRTIIAQCEPAFGTAAATNTAIQAKIEAIELPQGYEFEWGAEYEMSRDANEMLMANVPLCFGLMILIVIGLFNSVRQAAIVFLTVPLAIIGVTVGLLLADAPFGFVATLGFLSLSGMLIKNSIVLLEQIEINLRAGRETCDAILDAGVSRVRPVAMAAFTTVFGMVPLLWDRMFGPMAVTIMAGLSFATLLTLVIVPVLYAVFFRVRAARPAASPAS